MNCLSKEELTDYLFSQDRSIDRAGMEKHFSACAACRAKIETLEQLKAAAASVAPAPVSPDFTARLMRKVREQEAAPGAAEVPAFFPRLFRPAWGVALAAFLGILVLGAAYLAGRRTPPAGSAKALYFSDGPATVNSSFSGTEGRAAGVSIPGEPKAGYVYTDTCASVKCGIL